MTGRGPLAGTLALCVPAAMLLTMPMVAWQGPLHTTAMDAVNILFVACAWPLFFARRETVRLPFAVPLWLILSGGCLGLYAADDPLRALQTLAIDVYLYLWFVTLTHFLARRCRLDRVALVWVGVACLVAGATVADAHFGILGGQFAGTKRASGTFENPNMFGDYLVDSFFVAWAAGAVYPLALLAVPVLFLGVLSTASNGSLLSVIGGCGAMALSMPAIWTPRRLGALIVLAGVGLGVLGVWHEDIRAAAMARFSGGRSEVGGAAMKGADERLTVWQDVAYDVYHTPTGVGPGNFNRDGGAVSGDYHAAHSEYLGELAERSVIGFAGFLALLAGLLQMIRRLDRAAASGFRPLGVAPLYGVLGAIATHALVIELLHFRHVWLVLALIAAAVAQAAAVAPAALAPATPAALPEAA